jgi:type IV secretory pathway TraG/TraD family ATPase VirD4
VADRNSALASLRNNAVGPMIRRGSRKRGQQWLAWALVADIMAAFLVATEVFAARFKFQAALGSWHIGPLYQPFAIVGWITSHSAQFPDSTKLAFMAGLVTFLAGAGLIAAQRKRLSTRADPDHFLHGSAQWIQRAGLEQAALLHNDGAYVGGWVDPKTGAFEFLRHDGPEHILTIAPTRSGKGIGLVLPTLLSYGSSVVVADLKGELTALTSGHRAAALNNDILVFEPATAGFSARWNPLEEIRMGTEYETADVQNIATLIVDPDGKGLESHWQKTAQALLVGVILHALYRRREGVKRPLFDPEGRPVAKRLTEDKLYKIRLSNVNGVDGAPSEIADRTVLAGEPEPTVGQDGYITPGPSGQVVRLYDVEEVDAGEESGGDPRFRRKMAVKLPVLKTISVDYRFQTVDYPAPAIAPSMNEIDRLLADPNRPVAELWQEMLSFDHFAGREAAGVGPKGRTHGTIAKAARDMMDRPEEEAGSVVSTAKSFLELYRDPIVARNTEVSDFKIEDLMYGQKPVSLYIITQPTDKNRLRPLVRIMLNMMVRILAPKQVFEDGRVVARYNHKLLFMIDEFPSLGKLDIIQESLAFAAGYGLKFYLICQDITQLKSATTGYGPDELVSSNCQVQNFYAPNRVETAEYLSKMCGVTTVVNKNIATSAAKGLFAGKETISTSYSETSRPLMTPDEVMRMPAPKKDGLKIVEAGDMLIYMAGQPMIYGRQILYWESDYFRDAAAMKPATLKRFRRMPWIDQDGARRHSLMGVAEAEALSERLRRDPGGTPAPIGHNARWALPVDIEEETPPIAPEFSNPAEISARGAPSLKTLAGVAALRSAELAQAERASAEHVV